MTSNHQFFTVAKTNQLIYGHGHHIDSIAKPFCESISEDGSESETGFAEADFRFGQSDAK